MNTLGYILSLFGYFSLSFLFYVKNDFLSTILLCSLLIIFSTVIREYRRHVPLLVVVATALTFFHFISIFEIRWHWPFDFYLAAFIGFLMFRFLFRKPVNKLNWSFRFNKLQILSILIINVPAVFILFWYYQTHPEVADMWPSFDAPSWSIPFIILLIATINGLREEIFYRGLIQTKTSSEAPTWYSISLQAVMFGLLHFANAFPQGWMGVMLTAIWGGAISIQYRYFRSIALAWVTHAVADAIMFAIIIYTR